jgi:hypothetical protein
MAADYIGKSSIENLKVSFKYTRFTATDETIVIRDTTYSIDWKNADITVDGDVYIIDGASCSPSKRMNYIRFNGKTLTLHYSTDWKRVIGYELH